MSFSSQKKGIDDDTTAVEWNNCMSPFTAAKAFNPESVLLTRRIYVNTKTKTHVEPLGIAQ
jgi:hypothetical protein